MSLHPVASADPPRGLREELRADRAEPYTFKVHQDAHKTQVRQAVEQLFDVKVVTRQHHQGAAEAEAARCDPRASAGLEEGRRPAAARATRSRSSKERSSSMPIRRYKPTRPGRRFMSVSTFEEITKTKPEKSLLEPVTKKGGRNNNGRITTRHQGGGHKRRYRIIDFKRLKDGIPAKVAAIEYDPNRSARIALLHYADGAKAYILAPVAAARRRDGRVRPRRRHQGRQRAAAREHPDRHARPQRRAEAGRGAKMARSAGSGIQLVAKDGRHAVLRLPSGEMRRVPLDLPRDRRPGRQRRPPEHQLGQGRPQPLEGQAPVRARLGDEPGRPSARRRRGQVEGRPPSGHAVGRADARQAHALQAQGIEQADRPRPSPRQGGSPQMSRSSKKGPFVQERLLEPDHGDERRGSEEHDPHVVAHARPSSRRWSVTRSRSTTAASTSPCSSPSRWSGTSSASSRRPGRSAATRATRRQRSRGNGSGRDREATVRAQAKYVHSSARKARLVTDLIRGRSVPEARTILAFSRARGRARHREGAALRRRERGVAPRPALERRRPRRRDRVRRRGPDAEALPRPCPRPRRPDLKRTCHITVELAPSPAAIAAAEAAAAAARPKAASAPPKKTRLLQSRATTESRDGGPPKSRRRAEETPRRRRAKWVRKFIPADCASASSTTGSRTGTRARRSSRSTSSRTSASASTSTRSSRTRGCPTS